MSQTLPTAQAFGLSLLATSREKFWSWLAEQVKGHFTQTLVIFTPNPEQVVLAQNDQKFAQTLQKADVLIPDGQGLVVASQMLSKKTGAPAVIERITGLDTCQFLLEKFPDQTYLLIGGMKYDHFIPVEKKEDHYSLLCLGRTHVHWTPGYQNISFPTVEEDKKVLQVIHEVKPDVVFVAFGAPYQEEWVIRHREVLQQNKVKVAMVIGGAFDVLSGKLSRAPQTLRVSGLEWLFRLIQQPSRWRRQLRLFEFIQLTLQNLVK